MKRRVASREGSLALCHKEKGSFFWRGFLFDLQRRRRGVCTLVRLTIFTSREKSLLECMERMLCHRKEGMRESFSLRPSDISAESELGFNHQALTAHLHVGLTGGHSCRAGAFCLSRLYVVDEMIRYGQCCGRFACQSCCLCLVLNWSLD